MESPNLQSTLDLGIRLFAGPEPSLVRLAGRPTTSITRHNVASHDVTAILLRPTCHPLQ